MGVGFSARSTAALEVAPCTRLPRRRARHRACATCPRTSCKTSQAPPDTHRPARPHTRAHLRDQPHRVEAVALQAVPHPRLGHQHAHDGARRAVLQAQHVGVPRPRERLRLGGRGLGVEASGVMRHAGGAVSKRPRMAELGLQGAASCFPSNGSSGAAGSWGVCLIRPAVNTLVVLGSLNTRKHPSACARAEELAAHTSPVPPCRGTAAACGAGPCWSPGCACTLRGVAVRMHVEARASTSRDAKGQQMALGHNTHEQWILMSSGSGRERRV